MEAAVDLGYENMVAMKSLEELRQEIGPVKVELKKMSIVTGDY